MGLPVVLPAVFAAVLAAASNDAAQARSQPPKGPSACALLKTDDVRAVAGGEAPRLDEAASGRSLEETEDACVWVGKSSPDPLVQFIVKVPPGPNAPLIFTVTCGDYFGGGPDPAAVPGLGDEARYRNFIKGKGGTVVVRKGATVFSITGLLPRDTLVALAKLVVGRL